MTTIDSIANAFSSLFKWNAERNNATNILVREEAKEDKAEKRLIACSRAFIFRLQANYPEFIAELKNTKGSLRSGKYSTRVAYENLEKELMK